MQLPVGHLVERTKLMGLLDVQMGAIGVSLAPICVPSLRNSSRSSRVLQIGLEFRVLHQRRWPRTDLISRAAVKLEQKIVLDSRFSVNSFNLNDPGTIGYKLYHELTSLKTKAL